MKNLKGNTTKIGGGEHANRKPQDIYKAITLKRRIV